MAHGPHFEKILPWGMNWKASQIYFRALHKAIGWPMLSKEQKELCQPRRIGNYVHLFIYSFLPSSYSTEHLWQSIYWLARSCGCWVSPQRSPVLNEKSSCRRELSFSTWIFLSLRVLVIIAQVHGPCFQRGPTWTPAFCFLLSVLRALFNSGGWSSWLWA